MSKMLAAGSSPAFLMVPNVSPPAIQHGPGVYAEKAAPVAVAGAARPSSVSSLSSAAVPAALVASLAVAGSWRGRRQSRRIGGRGSRVRVYQQPPTTATKGRAGIIELASEMGMNLDVRPWELLTNIAKESARGWFIKRAEDRGIAWSESVAGFESHQDELNEIYEKIVDSSLDYPDYYTKPFHGYDYGNLGWTAAHELEAATQSMCLGYYEGMTWEDAQELFRGAARTSINDYWQETRTEPGAAPQKLLDVGCSGGFSSNEMAKVFPEAKITGVDLSPYFLSVAKHTYPHLDFVHANAEDTKLPAESQDVAALNFILHELPLEASRAVLREMHRVTAPGGVIAILDVDPRRLLELPPFRRWAFQVTEPWCKDGEYYSLKLEEELESLGFTNVRIIGNDPVNTLVLATKK